jgi:hypothetical protein
MGAIMRAREMAAASALDALEPDGGLSPDWGEGESLSPGGDGGGGEGLVPPLPVLPEANEWGLPAEESALAGWEGSADQPLFDHDSPLAQRIGGGGSGGGVPTYAPTAAPVCRRPPPNATLAGNGSLVLASGQVLDSWADPAEEEGEELYSSLRLVNKNNKDKQLYSAE